MGRGRCFGLVRGEQAGEGEVWAWRVGGEGGVRACVGGRGSGACWLVGEGSADTLTELTASMHSTSMSQLNLCKTLRSCIKNEISEIL